MFRKILALFMALTILTCSAGLAATLDETQLKSKSCILMDAATGEVLYGRAADVRRSPASTTKIMTLLIAISKSDPDEIVTVPASAGQVPLDSSVVPVYPGEKMPMRDLWYGLIFKSGNDAANAIAELVSGSVDAFVDEMNDWAHKLGMQNTHFANPHGYTDSEHYTTARDLAILTRYAMESDLFREITFSLSYTMQRTELRDALEIRHEYPITDYQSTYYYRYARGIKTGYTMKAGQCYVGSAQKDGRELIAVTLNCGTTKVDKWVDAKALFEYGFEKLSERDRNT